MGPRRRAAHRPPHAFLTVAKLVIAEPLQMGHELGRCVSQPEQRLLVQQFLEAARRQHGTACRQVFVKPRGTAGVSRLSLKIRQERDIEALSVLLQRAVGTWADEANPAAVTQELLAAAVLPGIANLIAHWTHEDPAEPPRPRHDSR